MKRLQPLLPMALVFAGFYFLGIKTVLAIGGGVIGAVFLWAWIGAQIEKRRIQRMREETERRRGDGSAMML